MYFYRFFRQFFQLPPNLAKVIIVKPKARTTLTLTLHGPLSTNQGLALDAELNSVIANYNSLWLNVPPNQQKITAVTSQVQ